MSQRILIIGGGMAGTSLAWWLGESGVGRHTVLLEREKLLGQHATGQNAAILRSAVTPWATRALAHETGRFLRHPPKDFSDAPLLKERGLVLAEGAEGDPLPAWLEDHLEWNAVESITPTRQRQLAPHFNPEGERCWWIPSAGEIEVARLLERFAFGARRAGVRIETGREVVDWITSSGPERRLTGVRLADGEELEADVVVVAAGAWAPSLSARLSIATPMRVTRRHLMVSAPAQDVCSEWPVVWDDRAGLYARPESSGLLVSACDISEVQPEPLIADPDVRQLLAEKALRILPSCGDLSMAHFWPGLRTLTDDDVPWLGQDAEVAGLFWLAGFGGHGMSVCAAAGQLAADMLCGHSTNEELQAALAPSRQVAVAAPL
ncbi:MAG: FAD-dependent oxidoreductase [Planctomycetota bacterium]|nr:FAD-dependent oxidoreductase [Planctomycetota bacterium]